jgi:16S rRNA U516 pseudouridylate synthase RsuA-like enzyme
MICCHSAIERSYVVTLNGKPDKQHTDRPRYGVGPAGLRSRPEPRLSAAR